MTEENKKPAESPEDIQAGPPQSKGLGGEPEKPKKPDPKPEPKVADKVAPTAVGVPTEVGKVPAKFKNLVDEIEKMTIMELADLVKILEKKFGVSPAVATAAPTAVGAPTEAGEEKSEFNIELKGAGDQKIQVIKAVREITGKGLKEAKDVVDSAPQVIKENVKKKEAEEIKEKLEKAGATVELK